MIYAELNGLNHLTKYGCLIEQFVLTSNTWNHSTVSKRIALGLFKDVINKMCLQIMYI